MDNSEQEKLSEIYDEVQGSHAQLGAIAERTRNIQTHLEDISEEVNNNSEDIDQLQAKVKRNSTIINAVTVGLSSVLIWVSDKIHRFLP